MKRFSVATLLGIILAGIILHSHSKEASGAEWVYYGSSKIGSFSYDVENVKETKGIVSVWVMSSATNEEQRQSRLKYYRDGGVDVTKYANWKSALSLYEYDCKEKRSRWLRTSDYNSDGIVIEANDFQEHKLAKWSDISPGTFDEKLYTLICENKDYLLNKRKWRYMYRKSNGNSYYMDAANIKRMTNKGSLIWRKEVFSTEYKESQKVRWQKNEEMKKFVDINDYATESIEIDCQTNRALKNRTCNYHRDTDFVVCIDYQDTFSTKVTEFDKEFTGNYCSSVKK